MYRWNNDEARKWYEKTTRNWNISEHAGMDWLDLNKLEWIDMAFEHMKQSKKMSDLRSLFTIIMNNKGQESPKEIRFGKDMIFWEIEIDKDHTATLFMHNEDLEKILSVYDLEI